MKQIFLRHRNGNGKKYGNDCEVSDDTFLDRRSSVADRAEVFNANIRNSMLCDNVLVCGYPGQITITDSFLTGNTRLWQAPALHDVSLKNVSVFGDAVVEGFNLEGFVRIHTGVWRRPPRFHVIRGPETNGRHQRKAQQKDGPAPETPVKPRGPEIEVTVSECTADRYHIGCWCLPWETWTRPGYRQMIGKRSGWTPEMVELCYTIFRSWKMSPIG